jgi:hypothetical protein
LRCEFEKLAGDVAKRRKLECLTAADPELNDPSARAAASTTLHRSRRRR